MAPEEEACQASEEAAKSARSLLVIVSNEPRSFRVHVYRRIATEIAGLALRTFYFRGGAKDLPEELHAHVLPGSSSPRWARPWLDWKKARLLRAHLEAHRSAIGALILDGYATSLTLALLRDCRRLAIPVFIRGDSNVRKDALKRSRWLKYPFFHWIVRQSTGFMPMASLGQQYFERYGARREQCFWVPSVPDYELFSDVQGAEVDRLREELGLEPARRYLLFVGHLVAAKRVDQLLQAMARIAGQRPDWDLLIVGDGPLEKELRARVPGHLAARIRWLGFRSQRQLRLIYKMAHAFVLPSDFEAWGVVVLEAMAAGIPVVASDVGGAAEELVEDGVSGRIFPAGDLSALTDALRDVTDARRSQAYLRNVPTALARWRRAHDPVEGVRAALRSVDALP